MINISIVTICYNNASDIERTIQSVFTQTYKNIEYIVIDGGSTDGTLDLLNNNIEKIDVLISEEDCGIYNAINKGLRRCNGAVVGLIHAGDKLFSNNVIEEIASKFEESSIDAIYGNSIIMNKDRGKIVRVNKGVKYSRNLFKIGWMPSHQSFYCKREIFHSLGYYDESLEISADYELLLRFIYVNNINVKYIDLDIVIFSQGGKSTKSLSNIINANRECISAWKKNQLKSPFLFIPLKMSLKIRQFFIAFLKRNKII